MHTHTIAVPVTLADDYLLDEEFDVFGVSASFDQEVIGNEPIWDEFDNDNHIKL